MGFVTFAAARRKRAEAEKAAALAAEKAAAEKVAADARALDAADDDADEPHKPVRRRKKAVAVDAAEQPAEPDDDA